MKEKWMWIKKNKWQIEWKKRKKKGDANNEVSEESKKQK